MWSIALETQLLPSGGAECVTCMDFVGSTFFFNSSLSLTPQLRVILIGLEYPGHSTKIPIF